MNKEYIKLNDDTVIVSDEYGHIITKRNSNDKVLAIENKIERTLYEIDDIDDFIECDKRSVSFMKKILVSQPFLLAGISAALCMGAPSPNILVTTLISGVIISPITICFGPRIKSLKKEIKQLHKRKDTANHLLNEYKKELYYEKSNASSKENNEKIVVNISDLKVEKLNNQEMINYVDEQLDKPYVKTLTKKRNK